MHPQVWADARPRIAAAAAVAGVTVAWPNEDFNRPEPPAIWLDIEFSSSSEDAIEIGARTWQEDGSLWLHFMLPRGQGIDGALRIKDALSAAFRDVPDAAVGLSYRGQSTDPIGEGTDNGVYRRMTLMVRYAFQSQLA